MTAGAYGYSGNMERLIAAQNAGQGQDNFMLEFAKMQKKVRHGAALLAGVVVWLTRHFHA